MTPAEIPNIISILRILLVIPTIWMLLTHRFDIALLLFFIAGVSDGLDGFLAKRYHWQSRLGALLDPMADKILLVSCYVVLGWLGSIPVWLVAAVILRDLVIVVGALVYHYKIEIVEGEPLWISKFNTLAQILLVLAVMVDQSLMPMPDGLLPVLFLVVLFFTIASGVAYVWVWGRRAARGGKG